MSVLVFQANPPTKILLLCLGTTTFGLIILLLLFCLVDDIGTQFRKTLVLIISKLSEENVGGTMWYRVKKVVDFGNDYISSDSATKDSLHKKIYE